MTPLSEAQEIVPRKSECLISVPEGGEAACLVPRALKKRRGGGGSSSSSGGGRSGYSGGSSSAGSSLGGFRSAAAPAPKAAPPPAPSLKPAPKPAVPKSAPPKTDPRAKLQVTAGNWLPFKPGLGPKPKKPKSGPELGDFSSFIPGYTPKPKKPKYRNPHQDHGHLPFEGSGSGQKEHKTARHVSSCSIGCRNALLGTLGAIAILGGIALLMWWLVVCRRRKGKRRYEEDDMELNTHSARGVSFTMSSPSIKFWQRRDRKESRSSSDGREQKPPLVAVEERSSFEYPPVFTATEAAGRASPVIVDVPPRSPSLRSGKSEDKRGSCGTGNSSSRRLSSVSEEDCVQPQEEELYTADKASNSSHSSTDKGDLCVKENQPDESHDDWKSSNTKCSSTAKSDQLNDQQGNQNEQVRAPSSELGF